MLCEFLRNFKLRGLLNGNYEGPDIKFHHALNPLAGKIEYRKVLRTPSSDEINRSLKRDEKLMDRLMSRLDRFFEISTSKRRTMRQMESIVNEAMEITPIIENEPIEDFVKRFLSAFEPKIFPLIRAAGERNRHEASRDFTSKHLTMSLTQVNDVQCEIIPSTPTGRN